MIGLWCTIIQLRCMPTLPRAENWPKRVMAAAVLTWVSSIQSLLVFCVSSRLHHGWGPALKTSETKISVFPKFPQKLTQLQLRWPPSLLRARLRTPKRDAPRCHAEPAAELPALRAEGRCGRFQIVKAASVPCLPSSYAILGRAGNSAYTLHPDPDLVLLQIIGFLRSSRAYNNRR